MANAMRPEPRRNLIRLPRLVGVTTALIILNALSQGCARREATDRPQTESGDTPSARVIAGGREESSDSRLEVDAGQDTKRAAESRAEFPESLPTGIDSGAVTQEVAEATALDEVVRRTKVSRDRLTADATKVDKFWYEGPDRKEPVLISGWNVLVWRRPAMPGGHYFLFVADDGEVKKFERGK